MKFDSNKRVHIVIIGDRWPEVAIESALTYHLPQQGGEINNKVRISILEIDRKKIDDFVFDYQELFDHSYWRIVDLKGNLPKIELHKPMYAGLRKDFTDIEWEFIEGTVSNQFFQSKLTRWALDSEQYLMIFLCFEGKQGEREGNEILNLNERYAEKFKRRLPSSTCVEIKSGYDSNQKELTALAKYLNYFYKVCFEKKQVPTELPEEEVNKAWEEIGDEKMKLSNIYNVMSIPIKMEVLGHDKDDWEKFYALSSKEIELLTELEHNRWSVERLIQGFRPCTDEEFKEIQDDINKRLNDKVYAQNNPVSLKKKYKNERMAHYDLCAYSELGIDETGLPVSRFDRDLSAAIPLIVKTYHDRHKNG